jgi:hypothetical protein
MRFARSLFASATALAVAAGAAACGGGGGGGIGSGEDVVTFLTTTVPPATTGQAYVSAFDAEFPHPPGVFLVTSGTVPPGLTLDKLTGQISGFPRQTGVFSFQVAARDGADEVPLGGELPPGRDATFSEARRTFVMQVLLGPPNILPQQLPGAQYRSGYGYQIDVAGGTPPYAFSQTGGTLPAGLTVASNGFVGSFPTQAQQTPYEFQVTVVDQNSLVDTDTLSVQVVVLPLIILTSDPLPQAAIGFPYSVTLAIASAGGGAPHTWSQVPPGPGETDLADIGMEVTAAGVLQHALPNPGPTGAAGTYEFTVQVTDEAAQVATRTLHVTLNPGPVLTSITPNRAAVPGPYTVTGANFQPGATLTFKPGPNQTSVVPTFVSPTTMTFNAVAAPAGGGGFVDVRVTNPDAGTHLALAAFAFPASNITFSPTPVFPGTQSPLSSTGLDVGDVGGPGGGADGFADVVHCGTNTFWQNASGTAPGVDVLVNMPSGAFNPASPPFARIVLSSSGDWYQVKFVDVDTDGRLDVAAIGDQGGSNVVRVWLNNGLAPPAGPFDPGTFETTGLNHFGSQTNRVSDAAFGRLTGPDALPDFAYVYQDFSGSTTQSSTWVYYTGSLASMSGAGSGSFSSLDVRTSVTNMYGGMSAVAVGAFDGDGQDDTVVNPQTAGAFIDTVAMVFYSSSNTGLFGGDTVLTRPGQNRGQDTEQLGAASGDVTGDGHADYAYVAGNNSWGGTPGLTSYQVSSSGTFTVQSTTNPASVPLYRYLAIGDLDFDTSLDFAATASQNRIDFYKGRPTGPLFRSTVTLTSVTPRLGRIAVGDFDRDGRPDICAAMSFFAEANLSWDYQTAIADRGAGSPQGVVIYLNTSN